MFGVDYKIKEATGGYRRWLPFIFAVYTAFLESFKFMNATYERARKGEMLAKAHVTSVLQTRIEKMAAYFGKQCGADPDDLRQEAWIAVLEMLPNLDLSVGSPEQHLLKRARWRILDTIRFQRRRQCMPLTEAHPHFESEGYLDIHCTVDMEKLLSRLTIIQRRILRGLMEGYTWREVGDIVGCTSANVAYHVRRIRDVYIEVEGNA